MSGITNTLAPTPKTLAVFQDGGDFYFHDEDGLFFGAVHIPGHIMTIEDAQEAREQFEFFMSAFFPNQAWKWETV